MGRCLFLQLLIKRTLLFGFALNLFAKTHPAEPAPIIIKSNSSIEILLICEKNTYSNAHNTT